MQDEYQEFQKFTDFLTGGGARREKIEAALRGEDDGGGDKKGKKKKKWAILSTAKRLVEFAR